MKNFKDVCVTPFLFLEINDSGDVYTCCPAYINNNKIGNIFADSSIENVWYSDKAKEIRCKILEFDYSLCNLGLCRQKQNIQNLSSELLQSISEEGLSDFFSLNPPLPKYITLAYDKECNLQCITCRDKKYKNTKEQVDFLNEKISTILLPLLKEAKIIALDGAGEAFYSSHSRTLIKQLVKHSPSLKFNINTNGILFNKENCEYLGLLGKINEVFVSLPALNKKIYKQIMIGSSLEIVLKNIKWMAEQQKVGLINKVTINMVVSSLNYKEIPCLVNFAKKLNIHITISQYCYWGTEFGKQYEKVAIWNVGHIEHKNFINILKNKSLSYKKCYMQPLFEKLRRE